MAMKKKVVKKVAARKPAAQKDVYTYDVKGCFITYNSLKEVEQQIHDEADAQFYCDGDEFEIYKLVKRVRIKASKMVIEEVK